LSKKTEKLAVFEQKMEAEKEAARSEMPAEWKELLGSKKYMAGNKRNQRTYAAASLRSCRAQRGRNSLKRPRGNCRPRSSRYHTSKQWWLLKEKTISCGSLPAG
jgi:hypothetical protein